MASDVSICNTAIMRVGGSQLISALTETSVAAQACNLAFEHSRLRTLTAAHWPFATKFYTGELVEANPVTEWAYAYRYPSDCLKIRRIVSGLGFSEAPHLPYKIGRDSSGKLIYTNQSDAEFEYTMNVTDTGQFTEDFASAMAWLIAHEIAPSQSRIKDMADYCFRMFQTECSVAVSNALSEEERGPQPDAEAILARQ